MLMLWMAAQLGGSTSPPAADAKPVVNVSGAQVPLPASCRIVDAAPKKAPSGGAGMLLAVCGSHGTPIGAADQYSASSNAATGSVLVVTTKAGKTRVLLVSSAGGGAAVHVDDISRDLAKLSGRAGDAGLGDFSVDASRFAIDGSVGATKAGMVRRLDLASYASRAAALVVPTPTPTKAGIKTGQ